MASEAIFSWALLVLSLEDSVELWTELNFY